MRDSIAAHRLGGLVRFGSAIVLLLQLWGCSSTVPRFRSSEDPDAAEESRIAGKIKEEESREDDKKVDVQQIRKKLGAVAQGSVVDDTPPGLSRDRVLLDVISYLGTPYKYGGMSRRGIDCSGFTATIYSGAADVKLPRSTKEQFTTGSTVERDELQFGDLVFFNTTGRTPSHVGIFIEGDLFAHASASEGVTFSSLESTYFKKRFVGARRVVS